MNDSWHLQGSLLADPDETCSIEEDLPSDPYAEFAWPQFEYLVDLTSEDELLIPEIQCAFVELGVFRGEQFRWSNYRRNDFNLRCNYVLPRETANGRLVIRRGDVLDKVQAMGMRLSAAVDESSGTSTGLMQSQSTKGGVPHDTETGTRIVQIAPKYATDRQEPPLGSQFNIDELFSAIVLKSRQRTTQQSSYDMDTRTDDSRDLQTSDRSGLHSFRRSRSHNDTGTEYTFRGLQFARVTARPDKREESRHCYTLTVHLHADVRKEGDLRPVWVEVARQTSQKIVVIGVTANHPECYLKQACRF